MEANDEFHVTFCYDFVEDFQFATNQNKKELFDDSQSSWEQPKVFKKENHPLLLIVSCVLNGRPCLVHFISYY